MAEDLKGRTVLITGGSSGMGFEMAKELLSRGASVIITARAGKRLDEAGAKLSELGQARVVPMDVTSEESVDAAARWVEENCPRLDMVISNAGIGGNAPGMADLPRDHNFWDIPIRAVRAVMDTNLVGFFMVASRFVPLMVKNGRGSLVYVSTSDATMTRRGQMPYGPSKAGAEAMAAIMAEELKELGVMVNVICPGGFTDTGMAPEGAKEFFRENGLPVLPPTVMNRAAAFLASPESDGISGEKIVGKDFDSWLESRGLSFQ